MWGGHSCPPFLILIFDLIFWIRCQIKIKVKSGGQECSPYIKTKTAPLRFVTQLFSYTLK